jgi:hypothetical protein
VDIPARGNLKGASYLLSYNPDEENKKIKIEDVTTGHVNYRTVKNFFISFGFFYIENAVVEIVDHNDEEGVIDVRIVDDETCNQDEHHLLMTDEGCV